MIFVWLLIWLWKRFQSFKMRCQKFVNEARHIFYFSWWIVEGVFLFDEIQGNFRLGVGVHHFEVSSIFFVLFHERLGLFYVKKGVTNFVYLFWNIFREISTQVFKKMKTQLLEKMFQNCDWLIKFPFSKNGLHMTHFCDTREDEICALPLK